MGIRVASLVLMIAELSLSGCGKREETPSYFTAVTNIPICNSATVINEHASAEQYEGTGVVYRVRLRMSTACKEDFLKKVSEFRRRAEPSNNADSAEKGAWIEVRESGPDLIVLYTE